MPHAKFRGVNWAGQQNYPLVLSFRLGSGGQGAKLVRTAREALRVGLPAHDGPVDLAPLPAGIRKSIGL